MALLTLSRAHILARRRRANGLDQRLPPGKRSLRQAAWAGLQDSMPRAALLSIHARVEGTAPDTWEDPSLVQVWGPRFSVFVVAARDHALFTLGRFPAAEGAQRRATDLADRLEALLGDSAMTYSEAGRALGEAPNQLRYATTTGRVLLRWEGARRPTIRMVPPPDLEPEAARRELARRYLRVFGPSTADSFGAWAGIKPPVARATFDALRRSLTPVATPIGDAWILARDEAALVADPAHPTPARLLPSGDAYYLQWGTDRELLVPDADRRAALWTPRVWPGAVLVDGEIAGTWRRAGTKLTISPWQRLTKARRQAVEAEAESLPLPEGTVTVTWEE